MTSQPAGPGHPGLTGSIAQDDDPGMVGEGGKGLGSACRRCHVAAAISKEVVEVALALGKVQVLALARPKNILEQGKPVDAHLKATAGQKIPEALHEQAQDLVNVHDQQRPVLAQPHLAEVLHLRNGVGLGHDGVSDATNASLRIFV